MSALPLQNVLPHVSSLAYGCMGLGGGWNNNPICASDIQQTHDIIDTALQNQINFFDHADIYTFGKAETVFGQVLKQRPTLRDTLYLQTKCGIRFEDHQGPKRYDLSSAWITHSVEKSLTALNTDYIDVLLLHRPDPLMRVSEIADTFHQLKAAGKVRFLGVSNMQQHQMSALQRALNEPLVVNQIEMSLQKHAWVDEAVYAGNQDGKDINFTPGTLEYCHQHNVQLQAWGSLCQGIYTGVSTTEQSDAVQHTSQLVARLAAEYGVSPEAILLSWLMLHPSQIQPVIGTTNLERIKACAQVGAITLSREHWYALYVSAKGHELP